MKRKLKRLLADLYQFPLGRRRTLSLFLSDDALHLLRFEQEGYLLEKGWFQSLRLGRPVDRYEAPVPWFTYPFLEFIENRLNQDMIVFEYGGGYSTLFFEKRVKSITSVEHDKYWYEKLSMLVSGKVNLKWTELDYGGKYCRKASETGVKYDIIVVDGRDRVNCCIHGFSALTDSGIVILDDSDRQKYDEAKSFLAQKDFKRIDFWGISPGNFNRRCTSVFYRKLNCMSI